MLTASQLSIIAPRVDARLWVIYLSEAFTIFSINSIPRLAAFLAQAAHESSEFTRLVENLNYSITGLMKTWPRRFPETRIATSYARQPEKIANLVYANRMGNGPPESGDGWRYRGRGIFQLTGKTNYIDAGKAIGINLEQSPLVLEDPKAASLSAGWFWKSRGLNSLADCAPGEDDSADFARITQIINGGHTGLASRQAYYRKALDVLI